MLKKKLMQGYLFLLFLILFDQITSQECKPVESYENANQPRINQLLDLYDAKNEVDENGKKKNLLFESVTTHYLLDPSDSTMMVKFEFLQPDEATDDRLEELMDSQTMSMTDEDYSQDNTIRIAPRVTETYCVEREHQEIGTYDLIIIVSDRFRRRLIDLTEDSHVDLRFIQSLTNMSSRFEFYSKIVEAYIQMADGKLKHCNLGPESILYVEEQPNFESDYDSGNNILTFQPALANFSTMVNWNDPCPLIHYGWVDKKDIDNSIFIKDSVRPKVELSALALLFLYTESAVLTALYKQKEISLNSMMLELSKLPKTQSEYLKKNFGIRPFQNNDLIQNFEILMTITKKWKANEIKGFSYTQELSTLEEFFETSKVFVKLILSAKGIDEESIPNFISVYKKFEHLLLEMSKENSITTNQRPTLDETLQQLKELFNEATIKESAYNDRRNIILL